MITISNDISPTEISPSIRVHDGERDILRLSRDTLEHLAKIHGVQAMDIVGVMVENLDPEIAAEIMAKMPKFLNNPPDQLDELCIRILSLGGNGGAEGGTNDMRASEIKELLVPFFGRERVLRCTDVLCGTGS